MRLDAERVGHLKQIGKFRKVLGPELANWAARVAPISVETQGRLASVALAAKDAVSHPIQNLHILDHKANVAAKGVQDMLTQNAKVITDPANIVMQGLVNGVSTVGRELTSNIASSPTVNRFANNVAKTTMGLSTLAASCIPQKVTKGMKTVGDALLYSQYLQPKDVASLVKNALPSVKDLKTTQH